MFLIYELSTGRVEKVYTGPDVYLPANVPDGFSAVPVDEGDDSTHRVDITATPHTAIEKTQISYSLDKSTIIANGSDAATISGLPDGARAIFNGDEYEPTLGSLTIVADLADIYRIELTHPLYLRTVVEITAE